MKRFDCVSIIAVIAVWAAATIVAYPVLHGYLTPGEVFDLGIDPEDIQNPLSDDTNSSGDSVLPLEEDPLEPGDEPDSVAAPVTDDSGGNHNAANTVNTTTPTIPAPATQEVEDTSVSPATELETDDTEIPAPSTQTSATLPSSAIDESAPAAPATNADEPAMDDTDAVAETEDAEILPQAPLEETAAPVTDTPAAPFPATPAAPIFYRNGVVVTVQQHDASAEEAEFEETPVVPDDEEEAPLIPSTPQDVEPVEAVDESADTSHAAASGNTSLFAALPLVPLALAGIAVVLGGGLLFWMRRGKLARAQKAPQPQEMAQPLENSHRLEEVLTTMDSPETAPLAPAESPPAAAEPVESVPDTPQPSASVAQIPEPEPQPSAIPDLPPQAQTPREPAEPRMQNAEATPSSAAGEEDAPPPASVPAGS